MTARNVTTRTRANARVDGISPRVCLPEAPAGPERGRASAKVTASATPKPARTMYGRRQLRFAPAIVTRGVPTTPAMAEPTITRVTVRPRKWGAKRLTAVGATSAQNSACAAADTMRPVANWGRDCAIAATATPIDHTASVAVSVARLLKRCVMTVSGKVASTTVAENAVTSRPTEATEASRPRAMCGLIATTDASLTPAAKALAASATKATRARRGPTVSDSCERVPAFASSTTTSSAVPTTGIVSVVGSLSTNDAADAGWPVRGVVASRVGSATGASVTRGSSSVGVSGTAKIHRREVSVSEKPRGAAARPDRDCAWLHEVNAPHVGIASEPKPNVTRNTRRLQRWRRRGEGLRVTGRVSVLAYTVRNSVDPAITGELAEERNRASPGLTRTARAARYSDVSGHASPTRGRRGKRGGTA